MSFADRISDLRTDANLTQERLAGLLNVSQRTVSSWESGERMPSVEKLCDLANYFKVSSDYLLARTDIPNIYENPIDTPTDPSTKPSYEHQPAPTTTEEMITLIQQVINDTIISKFSQ